MTAIAFFTLAFVGWCSEVPVFVCGMRALAGAGIMYIVISLAGTAAIRIIVDGVVETDAKRTNTGKKQ